MMIYCHKFMIISLVNSLSNRYLLVRKIVSNIIIIIIIIIIIKIIIIIIISSL